LRKVTITFRIITVDLYLHEWYIHNCVNKIIYFWRVQWNNRPIYLNTINFFVLRVSLFKTYGQWPVIIFYLPIVICLFFSFSFNPWIRVVGKYFGQHLEYYFCSMLRWSLLLSQFFFKLNELVSFVNDSLSLL